MSSSPISHPWIHRRMSRVIPRTQPERRRVLAILLSLKRKEKSTDQMLDMARLGKYDPEILITIIDLCRNTQDKVRDPLLFYLNRKRIVTLFVKLYRESGNKQFYNSLCRVPFITIRDQRLIFNTRFHYFEKKVSWWHDWPFLMKRSN